MPDRLHIPNKKGTSLVDPFRGMDSRLRFAGFTEDQVQAIMDGLHASETVRTKSETENYLEIERWAYRNVGTGNVAPWAYGKVIFSYQGWPTFTRENTSQSPDGTTYVDVGSSCSISSAIQTLIEGWYIFELWASTTGSALDRDGQTSLTAFFSGSGLGWDSGAPGYQRPTDYKRAFKYDDNLDWHFTTLMYMQANGLMGAYLESSDDVGYPIFDSSASIGGMWSATYLGTSGIAYG